MSLGMTVLALAMAGVLLVDTGDGTINRGVEVGGVKVGGMSRAEAGEALQRGFAPGSKKIGFGENDEAVVSGESLGVKLDVEESVGKAYAVGREGWIGERFSKTLRGYLGGVEVQASVSYEEDAARRVISGFADDVYRAPENATYEPDGEDVEVVNGVPGRELDVDRTLVNLQRSLNTLGGRVPLATRSVAPEETAEELERLAPTKKIGAYKTDYRYSDSQGRRENLEKASGAVNGTVLSPGEIFSFNDLAAGLDYSAEKVFAGGGESLADGGGLCQVSSTLYVAANEAGLEVVERQPHYTTLPYIRPGFDATIWFGGEGIPEIDMKFKNTTDKNVLVREFVDEEGFLNAEIYGQPTGRKVEMSSQQDFEDLDRGIKWSTYKTIKEDGKVVDRERIHEDLYSFPPPAETGGYNEVRAGGW